MARVLTTGAGAAALAVAIWLAPTPVLAQPSADDQARIHFQAGTNYFQIADYESALREYRRAHDLTGRVPLLYNIYLCHERLGDVAHAVEALQRFLDDSPEDLSERATLEQRLQTMRQRLSDQGTGTDPVTDSGTGQATDAGTDTGTGQATDADTDPDAGSGTGSDVGAGPPVGQGPDTSAHGDGGMPVIAVVGFVVAGGFLAASLVFGGLALSEDSDLDGRCGGACREEELDTLRTFMNIADVSLGIALLAGGTALVAALVAGGDEVESGRATVSPWLAPGAGGASARVVF